MKFSVCLCTVLVVVVGLVNLQQAEAASTAVEFVDQFCSSYPKICDEIMRTLDEEESIPSDDSDITAEDSAIDSMNNHRVEADSTNKHRMEADSTNKHHVEADETNKRPTMESQSKVNPIRGYGYRSPRFAPRN